MTTIALRHGILAADSLASTDNLAAARIDKIIPGKLGIAATINRYGPSLRVIAWLNDGQAGPQPYGDALWFPNEGEPRLYFEKSFEWLGLAPFWAWGSGRQIALGAMQRDCSAVEAVEAAIVWDIYTDGPVKFIELPTKKGPELDAPAPHRLDI